MDRHGATRRRGQSRENRYQRAGSDQADASDVRRTQFKLAVDEKTKESPMYTLIRGRNVVRKTGLSKPASGSASPADAPPDVFAAVEDQLGLRLEAKKGPVELLILDPLRRRPRISSRGVAAKITCGRAVFVVFALACRPML